MISGGTSQTWKDTMCSAACARRWIAAARHPACGPTTRGAHRTEYWVNDGLAEASSYDPAKHVTNWTYDQAGNLLSDDRQTYVYDALSRVTSTTVDSTTTHSYTGDGVLVALTVLVDAGATLQHAVRDVGGGKLIATVKDAVGNVIGLIQPQPRGDEQR